MPATEQTWRNLKVMHLVFGITSLAMLAATIWVWADDHNREWRADQTTFEHLEDWTKNAQLVETNTPGFFGEEARLDRQLYLEQLTPPPEVLVNRFLAEALYDRYQKDRGAQPSSSANPLVEKFARLRAVPLVDLSQTKNAKLLSDVLSGLKKEVNDDTDIEPAYENLLKAIPPTGDEKNTVAASARPSDKPAATPQIEIDEAVRRKVVTARDALLAKMRELITRVKFDEDMMAGRRKFRRADYDATRSELDVAIRDGRPQRQRDEIQARITVIFGDVNQMTAQYERYVAQRLDLEQILKAITDREDLASKNLTAFRAKRDQLVSQVAEQNSAWRSFWQEVIEMPPLDGFSPRLRIDQIWLPNLTINNNFRDVARFDRCTTCHLGIDKTGAGSATAPLYPPLAPPQVVELPTPKVPPPTKDSAGRKSGEQPGRTTQELYGLQLAQYGAIHSSDVTIEAVWPRTPAAQAGLMRGDIITEIRVGSRSEKIARRDQALRYMLYEVNWGQPLKLTVRHGVPQPFAAHPRLDLYIGSLSPHKLQGMGCTICHQGQGSATSFKWASHTPNSLKQQDEWERDYGYFDNHHWIYPMYPDRFIESTCLKCHHDVVDLRPSPRYPDPPAPKVVAGFELIARFGCYGCHEIIGYDGPKRVGPDMRNEPMYYAAAAALGPELPPRIQFFKKMQGSSENDTAIATQSLADLNDIGQLATKVSQHPEDSPTRLRLLEYLQTDAARSTAPDKLLTDPGLTLEMLTLAQDLQAQPDDLKSRSKLVKLLESDQQSLSPQLKKESYNLIPYLKHPPELSAAAQRLADQLKTIESPGTLRKVGPSLRHIASKLGEGTINRWIYNPRSIRDSTKMPRFFGLMDKLSPDAAVTAALYEPIEVRAIAQYLVDNSQPFAYDKVPPTVTEPPSLQRGELLFKTRGCLACHKNAAVPEGQATFGPELTGLDKKIRTEKGKQWLRSWLRHPDRYHLRTAMPYNFLDPILLTDEQGKTLQTADGRKRMTDPAADIALWLLGPNWKPEADGFTSLVDSNETDDAAPGEGAVSGDDARLHQQQLDAQALKFLRETFPNDGTSEQDRASEYLAHGIPPEVAKTLKGHEVQLAGKIDNLKKRRYVRLKALDALAREYLLSAFPEEQTKQYLANGIPADVGATLKGPEIDLVGPITLQKKLDYVGRRAIGKYGCSGCHDVPGFESARPIGTGLADWGRKETSKLAFEHILEYLSQQQPEVRQALQEGPQSPTGSYEPGSENPGATAHDQAVHSAGAPSQDAGQQQAAGPQATQEEAPEPLDPKAWGPDGYFVASLMEEHREGFLWQKLRQPRSYDYEKTANKGYNEWLRMPQFNLSDAEREQIMTFVLGLVSEPPAAQYVYHADPKHAALIEGERVLMKFNCAGCHMLETAQWKIEFTPDMIAAPAAVPTPPYLEPDYTLPEIQQSQQVDRRGLMSSLIHGMQTVDKSGRPEEFVSWSPDKDTPPDIVSVADLQGQPIGPDVPKAYNVELWQPALLAGSVFQPKDPLGQIASTLLPKNPGIVTHYPPRGGDFGRLLLPIAIATQNTPSQKLGEGPDAWAWVPPPLVGEGRKTQPQWMHDFLLDPQRIRPGVILRMPRFNMSSDDATALVQYFEARDNADYPHQFSRDDRGAQQAADRAYEQKLQKEGLTGSRLGDAEKIVLNKSGCVTCHMVGDFTPQQSDRAMGPNLANVHARLQPDYVRRWIAKPSLTLPYTKMPVNFPYNPEHPEQDGFWVTAPGSTKPVQLYHGNSLEQIDAVTDLLMHWDQYLESQTSIRQQVEAAGGAPAPAAVQPPK